MNYFVSHAFKGGLAFLLTGVLLGVNVSVWAGESQQDQSAIPLQEKMPELPSDLSIPCQDRATRDGIDKNTEALKNLRQWCLASQPCQKMEIGFLNFRFIGIDVLRPNGAVQQRFRAQNQMQFFAGGVQEWNNAMAKFAQIQANAQNVTSIFAPITCMPPCGCDLKPLNPPNAGWKVNPVPTALSEDYTITVNGQAISLRSLAQVTIRTRLRTGTCKPF